MSVLCGCGTSELERKTNASHALSQLKKFQTATTVYETEHGQYASLETLLEEDPSGLIDAEFGAAWEARSQPTPLSGYLFAAMDAEDESERIGLCAYPSEPGKSGDLILCTFADSADLEDEEVGGGFISFGEEWSFYVANADVVDHPPRYWPGEGIPKQFARLRTREPAQALEEAWQLVEAER